MALADFLVQTCDVRRQARDASGTVPQDALGGAVRDPYATVHAAVPCLVRPLNGSSFPRHDKATTSITHRVYFARDLGFTSEHQIHVAGMVLAVAGPVNYNSLDRLTAVDCEEVRV